MGRAIKRTFTLIGRHPVLLGMLALICIYFELRLIKEGSVPENLAVVFD